MSKPVIMCVDDEKTILDTLSSQILSYLGESYELETASSGEEALELFQDLVSEEQEIAVVVSDQLMPGLKGDELLVRVHRLSPQTLNILLTGQADADAVGRALNEARLYRYMTKPWEKTDLMLTIEEAVRSYYQARQITRQNQMMEALYYASMVLGKETSLANLAPRILDILLDNTPAERATLVLVEDGRPGLTISYRQERRMVAGGGGPIFGHPRVEQDIQNDLSFTVLEYLLTNRVRLNLPNCRAEPWISDPYIISHQPRSVLATPVSLDDQLVAIFYLENFSRYEAFGNEALEFIQLFSVSAGMSLEKAKLYDNLELKVAQRTEVIQKQKDIIEQKNLDITDSIQYASRIQTAILPDTDILKDVFPDAFVFYEPKDIVSGDFYWFDRREDLFYFAAADCTGHGVPGAMLAVLGANTLHNIVTRQALLSPGQVLNLLNTRIHERLGFRANPDDPFRPLDGMDIGLCCYNVATRRLQYAGANRPLYLLRRGEELQELKGDKTAIGGHTDPYYMFENHEIQLESHDIVYVFSDGITDQFGGQNNRKYTPARLRQLLTDHRVATMTEVGQKLRADYLDWRGDGLQTDDVLVIGVRTPE